MKASSWRQLVAKAQDPVVFFANAIGDTILNLPALRALACLFNGQLTLVCAPFAHPLCYAELPLRRVVTPAMWWADERIQFQAGEVIDEIGGCDAFLCLAPWRSASLDALIRQIEPRYSVGYYEHFAHCVVVESGWHAAERAFALPKAIDPCLELFDHAAAPQFPLHACEAAARLRANLPAGTRVLAVHPDSHPRRMWSTDRWVTLFDAFLARHPEAMIFVVGRTPQPLDAGRQGERVVLCYGLPLAASMAVVAQADLFVGIDSSMLHVADLCGVPGAGLFGPSDSREWGFRFAPHRHVEGYGTMEGITVEAVLEALETLYVAKIGNTVFSAA